MIKRHGLVEDKAIKISWKHHLAMWEDIINLLKSKGFDIQKKSKETYFINFHNDSKIQAELRVYLSGNIEINFCNDVSFVNCSEQFDYASEFLNEIYYLDQVDNLKKEVIEPKRNKRTNNEKI